VGWLYVRAKTLLLMDLVLHLLVLDMLLLHHLLVLDMLLLLHLLVLLVQDCQDRLAQYPRKKQSFHPN